MLEDVCFAVIRLEVQLCLSVALADVTQCDLGTEEQWAKAGAISLMQTHSQPCYILLPGVSHQFPLGILVTGTGKHGSMNLFASSFIPVFPGEED